MAEVDKACYPLLAVKPRYYPKGTFALLAGLYTYRVGNPNSNRAIIAVCDIFGWVAQTLQGADLLSQSLNALVLVPDYFGEDGKTTGLSAAAIMERMLDIDEHAQKLREWLLEAKASYKDVKFWGCYGLGWGGKVAVMCSGAETGFKAAGAAHPRRLAKGDAENLTIPFVCLFSKEDGTPQLEREYRRALEKNNKDNVVEKFDSMRHGWMGAKANLKEEENLKQYYRGYTRLANFFAKHL